LLAIIFRLTDCITDFFFKKEIEKNIKSYDVHNIGVLFSGSQFAGLRIANKKQQNFRCYTSIDLPTWCYLKLAGENTPIQSSLEGFGWKNSTCTHPLFSPCRMTTKPSHHSASVEHELSEVGAC
jgi:hypothetical protein